MNKPSLQEALKERILIMDGAMGTMIQQENLSPQDFGGEELEGCNEMLVLKRPDVIQRIHEQYLEAGADIIETNTFGAASVVLAEYDIPHLAREINLEAARIAVESMASHYENYVGWQRELRTFLQSFGDDVHLLSTEAGAPYITSFSVRGLKGEILINALQKEGVIVSTSSACSSKQKKTSHVVEALQIDQAFKNGVLRLSFGMQTTEADVKAFIQAFGQVMKQLKGELVG